jgi:hypothetical protein
MPRWNPTRRQVGHKAGVTSGVNFGASRPTGTSVSLAGVVAMARRDLAAAWTPFSQCVANLFGGILVHSYYSNE